MRNFFKRKEEPGTGLPLAQIPVSQIPVRPLGNGQFEVVGTPVQSPVSNGNSAAMPATPVGQMHANLAENFKPYGSNTGPTSTANPEIGNPALPSPDQTQNPNQQPGSDSYHDEWSSSLSVGTRSFERRMIIGILVMFILIFIWGGLWPITGAVITQGQILMGGSEIEIQHPEGGILKEMYVENGQLVTEGQPLFSLDETAADAAHQSVEIRQNQFLIDEARVQANLDHEMGRFELPETVHSYLSRYPQSDLADYAMAAQEQYAETRQAHEAQLRLLEEDYASVDAQLKAAKQSLVASSTSLALIRQDIDRLSPLAEKGFIPARQITDLQRQEADAMAAVAAADSQIEQLQRSTSKLARQKEATIATFREGLSAQMGEVRAQLAAIGQEIRTTSAQRGRVEFVAPVSGFIDRLASEIKGAVFGGGQPIAVIVPNELSLLVELTVMPPDIDKIELGQHVRVQFSSTQLRGAPLADGTVTYISPAPVLDEASGTESYKIRAKIDSNLPIEVLREITVNGIPVTGFVQTHKRTFLSYLTDPVQNAMIRAFKN